MLFAYAHVKFDFKLLKEACGSAGVLCHDFVGEDRVEFDVELAEYGLELQNMLDGRVAHANCSELHELRG